MSRATLSHKQMRGRQSSSITYFRHAARSQNDRQEIGMSIASKSIIMQSTVRL